MAKITVDIDKSHLDEISKERIKDLERQLKNAENRENRLKNRVQELEGNIQMANIIVQFMKEFVHEYSSELGVKIDYDSDYTW